MSDKETECDILDRHPHNYRISQFPFPPDGAAINILEGVISTINSIACSLPEKDYLAYAGNHFHFMTTPDEYISNYVTLHIKTVTKIGEEGWFCHYEGPIWCAVRDFIYKGKQKEFDTFSKEERIKIVKNAYERSARKEAKRLEQGKLPRRLLTQPN